ncbi:hypothetical protein MX572_18825 [Rhodococcus pyridinivorans]|nr:hypothetical protein [Rhodococcus pyridinivorans]UTM36552.1 hypothetical protein MX572_18825 [Rhodococcus pyridinivorans]
MGAFNSELAMPVPVTVQPWPGWLAVPMKFETGGPACEVRSLPSLR